MNLYEIDALESGECRWIGRHDVHVYCRRVCGRVNQPQQKGTHTMNSDTRNRRLEALGIAESISMRLREAILNENGTARFTACEYGDMARTLKDIEDRLYNKGEYAPENIGSVRGGAR